MNNYTHGVDSLNNAIQEMQYQSINHPISLERDYRRNIYINNHAERYIYVQCIPIHQQIFRQDDFIENHKKRLQH